MSKRLRSFIVSLKDSRYNPDLTIFLSDFSDSHRYAPSLLDINSTEICPQSWLQSNLPCRPLIPLFLPPPYACSFGSRPEAAGILDEKKGVRRLDTTFPFFGLGWWVGGTSVFLHGQHLGMRGLLRGDGFDRARRSPDRFLMVSARSGRNGAG